MTSKHQSFEPVAARRFTVLLIAYHFPPDASSTGRLRTLGFARHLPSFGWDTVVLSPKPIAYERTDVGGLADVPDYTTVYRSWALDTRRHLGWRGRYASWLAVPDRWVWWWPTAVARGLSLIRSRRIDAIWSTYPIATTHLIGLTLARLSGLPWIADFRDPVVPAGSAPQQRSMAAIERRTVERASRLVFTTPGAQARYRTRFPQAAPRMTVVPNGYEQSALAHIDTAQTSIESPFVLVHSGLLYNRGRNPAPFFAALAKLKAAGTYGAATLRIVLRASGHEDEYQARIDALDIADMVSLQPPIAYRDALAEQARADGLLLFQGPEFNAQIPAKIFEYLQISRPVFALTDTEGDTAELLRRTGGATLAAIDDADAIAAALERFLDAIGDGVFQPADASVLRQYSRYACAERLGQLLDETKESVDAS